MSDLRDGSGAQANGFLEPLVDESAKCNQHDQQMYAEERKDCNKSCSGYYQDDWKILKVPIWRFLSSLIVINCAWGAFTFTFGVLCTYGMRAIATSSIIVASVYCVHAVWNDRSIVYPPTWTFLKSNGIPAPIVLLIIAYTAVLTALASAIMAVVILCSYVDFRAFVKWEC